MNKKELIQATATKSGMLQIEVTRVLSAMLDTISESLDTGDAVTLLGFGTFSVKERSARKGINPKTKEVIDIPAKKVVQFKRHQKK